MTVAIDHRRTALHEDLMGARNELSEARRRQRQKDSPSNRTAVAACLTTMDALLDAYLATGSPRS